MTQDELDQILARTEAAGGDWMRGEWAGYQSFIAHQDDISIYGPFGGPAIKGWAAWDAMGNAAVRQFKNGTSKTTLVQSYASGDLLVLVLLEEQSGDVGGAPNQPWALRITQVYRCLDGEWRVVHRHADPLTRRRNLEETAALASA